MISNNWTNSNNSFTNFKEKALRKGEDRPSHQLMVEIIRCSKINTCADADVQIEREHYPRTSVGH